MLRKYYNNNTLSTHLPTNAEGCHMSNFISQNEINIVNDPLKVQKPVLECSSEMDKLRCITDNALSSSKKLLLIKIIAMGTNFPSREFGVMENFNLLTLGQLKYSIRYLKKSKNVVYWFLRSCRKQISAKSLRKSATSVKILQICMDLQDSVQRSLQNPAEKSCRSAQIRKHRKPGWWSIGGLILV